MKFVGPRGETFDLPDPKAEPTQELLGDVYDLLDDAVDLIECVYQATHGPDHHHKTTNALRVVLEIAKHKISVAQGRIHDTIAWAK